MLGITICKASATKASDFTSALKLAGKKHWFGVSVFGGWYVGELEEIAKLGVSSPMHNDNLKIGSFNGKFMLFEKLASSNTNNGPVAAWGKVQGSKVFDTLESIQEEFPGVKTCPWINE